MFFDGSYSTIYYILNVRRKNSLHLCFVTLEVQARSLIINTFKDQGDSLIFNSLGGSDIKSPMIVELKIFFM